MGKKLFLNIDNFLGGLSLTLIILVTVISVFMRFIMDQPLVWTEEVSLALFVWFTFMGASAVTKEDGHVGIDYFIMKLPPKAKRMAFILREIIVLIINVSVFIYLGSQLTLQAGDKMTSVLKMSYMFIDISVVLSGILGTIHIIRRIIRLVKTSNHQPPNDKELTA